MYPDCPCEASFCLEGREVGVPLQPAPPQREPGCLAGTRHCRGPQTLVSVLPQHL